MGEIASLCIQPAPSDHEVPYRYNRVPVEAVTLTAGYGIEGDHKAGHNPNRQINIMSAETLQELRHEGFQVGPGEMGEQIVIQGIDVAELPEGTLLQLGTAQIALGTLRTGCAWFEQIQGLAASKAARRMGRLAHVEISGAARVGDPVEVVRTAARPPNLKR